MRKFDYTELPAALLTPEISGLLSAIHEYRGKQDLYIAARKDILNALLETAFIQSTDASNRIEGIFTSDARLKELVVHQTTPRNRNEKEIAGYRDVLSAIHENYDYIPVTPNTILQLHRDLYSYLAHGVGGRWKHGDNIIAETNASGEQYIRFQPVSSMETPDAIRMLCESHDAALKAGRHDPLLLSVLFVFDFLCIHPFDDGNGRMSRLLTLLMLYRAGYIVGKYVSIEMFIEKSKETYYEALLADWHENHCDYRPFVQYYLGTLLKTYREFEERVNHILTEKTTKKDRIRMVFEQKIGRVSKRDILDFCPDISMAMIERTLKELLDSGFLEKVGAGKNTAYVKFGSAEKAVGGAGASS